MKEILEKYNSETLNKEQAIEISEALRFAGLRGGPELDSLIRAEGFDPDFIKQLSPPPPDSNAPEDQRGAPRTGNQRAANQMSVKSYESLEADYKPSDFAIYSPAIENGELLEEYKCESKINGIEKSIPLNWSNIPAGSKSLAIMMYHYPNSDDKTKVNSYLLLWGINPEVKEIAYGGANTGDWYMGQNKDGNAISYTSPCSPSAGIHDYTITIFALAEHPDTLPLKNSLDVDFSVFMDSVENVEILGKAEINFKDIND